VAAAATLVLVAAGVEAATATTQVVQKNPGGVTAVGPVNGDNGFPAWYADKAGTRLELCLDGDNPLCGFLPGDIPDETQPVSFPENFPEEVFYFLAGSSLDLPGGGRAVLTLGLEAAFTNGVAPGEQMTFARQRIVVKGAPANATLTFRHPYGSLTIDTDRTGAGRLVEDISPATGNFATALKGNLGPFLRWDPATAPSAPAGYLGDPAQDHTVVGSPFGFNRFAVTGAGLDASTDQFTVQAKLSTNTGVQADSAVTDGDYIDITASSTGTQLQVEGQPGVIATTPMVTDPGSDRFYARVRVSGPVPSQVKLVNIGDRPASSSTVPVTRDGGIIVTRATYDGARLVVAATSTRGYPLTVAGVGRLDDDQATAFALAAPPASVVVSHADGGSATLPVRVVGGPATPQSQPAVPPDPDPGPVVDTGGGAVPSGPTALATAPVTGLARGASTQVDGSASTGAVAYQWSQLSGPPVSLSSATVAKPTVSVPFFTKTTDTTPVPAAAEGPARLQLVVTGPDGPTSSPATVDLTVVTDDLVIDAGARHRLGNELRVSGTSTLPGATGVLAPATSVLVYDTTPGRAVTKLGNAPVTTLGTWSLKVSPGPTRQVTSVLVQSTRGGTSSSSVATK
jgi:hypothetical protein